MEGICVLCQQNKKLTRHHIVPKSYNGKDNHENLIPNICRECHNALEEGTDGARRLIGAGRDSEVAKSFQVGKTSFTLQTGSVLLSDNGLALIDIDSPIYGTRIHNKITGQQNIEVFISGGIQLAVVGSPANSWVVYSISK